MRECLNFGFNYHRWKHVYDRVWLFLGIFWCGLNPFECILASNRIESLICKIWILNRWISTFFRNFSHKFHTSKMCRQWLRIQSLNWPNNKQQRIGQRSLVTSTYSSARNTVLRWSRAYSRTVQYQTVDFVYYYRIDRSETREYVS